MSTARAIVTVPAEAVGRVLDLVVRSVREPSCDEMVALDELALAIGSNPADCWWEEVPR